MDDARDEEQHDRRESELERGDVFSQQHIRQHHNARNVELHYSPVTGGDVLERLVEHDDNGVGNGGDKAENDALEAVQPGLQNAGDEHHTEQRHSNAAELARGQPLSEERGGQREEDGRHIIAHRGHGDGGIIIRLEEQQPVEAEQRTGEKKCFEIAFHGGAVYPCACDDAEAQQKEKADGGAGKRDEAGGIGNVLSDDADRAVYEKRDYKLEFIGIVRSHCLTCV